MRKFLSAILVVLFTLTMVKPNVAHAEIPVKAKAFMTIAGYGAAGGALLGAASMAFGTNSRAIAQGASLGLYAGILFGTYVLISHHNKRYGSYEDSSSPYRNSSDVYGDEYDADEGGSSNSGSGGGFFDRFQVLNDKLSNNQSFTFDSQKRKGGQLPPIQVNFLQLSF